MFKLVVVAWLLGASPTVYDMSSPYASQRSCTEAGEIILKGRRAWKTNNKSLTNVRLFYSCVPIDSPQFLKRLEGYTDGNG